MAVGLETVGRWAAGVCGLIKKSSGTGTPNLTYPSSAGDRRHIKPDPGPRGFALQAPRVFVPFLLMAIASLLRASLYLPSKPLREKKPSREDKTLEVNPRGDQPTDCGRNGPFFGPTCGSGQTILWRSRDRRLVSLSFACLEFSD